jgi:hypothetical protein
MIPRGRSDRLAQFEKHFSVAEANALLPLINSVLDAAEELRSRMTDHQDELDAVHERIPGNGGGAHGAELASVTEMIGRLVVSIQDKGVIVKNLDEGLVDFPHWRDNHEVFLCWKRGEKSVGHWHELDAGFRGRQPL